MKDEVVIGLSADELSALGGNDAGAVAKALAAKGTLTVWQYAVRKARMAISSRRRGKDRADRA